MEVKDASSGSQSGEIDLMAVLAFINARMSNEAAGTGDFGLMPTVLQISPTQDPAWSGQRDRSAGSPTSLQQCPGDNCNFSVIP